MNAVRPHVRHTGRPASCPTGTPAVCHTRRHTVSHVGACRVQNQSQTYIQVSCGVSGYGSIHRYGLNAKPRNGWML